MVQPGGGGRHQRDSQAVLRRRRQQGLRHHGHSGRTVRAARATSSGRFPFHTFWGPRRGLPCTDWIARAAAEVLERERPDLTLVYLPHLDYDPQRFGPSGCDMARLVGELDDACAPLLDAARAAGRGSGWSASTAIATSNRPVLLNRVLREAGLLERATGPVRRDARHVRQPGLRRLRSSARPCLRRADRTTSRASATLLAGLAGRGAGPARERERREIGPGPSPVGRTGRALASPTPGSPIPSGWMTAWPPISPGPSTSIASPATTRASYSSTRKLLLAQGPRDPPADPEEARVPDAFRRGPARSRPGARQPWPAREGNGDRPILIADGPQPEDLETCR